MDDANDIPDPLRFCKAAGCRNTQNSQQKDRNEEYEIEGRIRVGSDDSTQPDSDSSNASPKSNASTGSSIRSVISNVSPLERLSPLSALSPVSNSLPLSTLGLPSLALPPPASQDINTQHHGLEFAGEQAFISTSDFEWQLGLAEQEKMDEMGEMGCQEAPEDSEDSCTRIESGGSNPSTHSSSSLPMSLLLQPSPLQRIMDLEGRIPLGVPLSISTPLATPFPRSAPPSHSVFTDSNTSKADDKSEGEDGEERMKELVAKIVDDEQ